MEYWYFSPENVFENIVCKMLPILFRSQWLISAPNTLGKHIHDDVIKWKHFPRYWRFVRGIHRSAVNSPHTKVSDAELCYFLWSAPEKNGWVRTREAGDLSRHRVHIVVKCEVTNVSSTEQSLFVSISAYHFYVGFVQYCITVGGFRWFWFCCQNVHIAAYLMHT